jgi:hypothetical protein
MVQLKAGRWYSDRLGLSAANCDFYFDCRFASGEVKPFSQFVIKVTG